MKRRCKRVDITDRNHIRRAILSCLKGKWRRRDVVNLMCRYDPFRRSRAAMAALLRERDKSPVMCVVERLADVMRGEMLVGRLEYAPARYRMRYDSCCSKWREIGVHDIKQQIYDYIAVQGLEEVLARIGEYQCASIPGRGQSYGIRAVRRWLRNPEIKYAWKGDIRKCFPSIERGKLMAFLRERVANERLLWLVDTLLASMPHGLSIGSYLSQWLCNLYLSRLYHFISERCWAERRGRRVPMARHVLFYMDDILLLGTNSKHLLMAARRVESELREMWLELKPDWRLWKLDDASFIDIMGVRVYRHHITVRRRVFRRLRRALKAAGRVLRKCRWMMPRLARRVAAYFGLLKHTDSYGVARRLGLWRSLAAAKETISYEAHGAIRCAA